MSGQITQTESECGCELPGEKLDTAKMPGHWLLARLGKRVLRPGGLGLTRKMLSALKLTSSDHVVEFAPGLGVTAQMTLAAGPASYTAVERDATATNQVRGWLERSHAKCPRNVITGLAQQTGLPDASATVVYGEAMLSMQSDTHKRQIIHEAMRLLQHGGRYGIHELCLGPDDPPPDEAETIRRNVTAAIHHQAAPLTVKEWEALLKSDGFEIAYQDTAPMALLEPVRLIKDEGFIGAARFLWSVLRDRAARARVLAMRRAFRQHRHHLAAICIVARKPPETSAR